MNQTKMNPWMPMTSALDLKVIGKLGEELGECSAAVARCIIQGVMEREPVTGKPNIRWLSEEIADVQASSELTIERFGLDQAAITERKDRKKAMLREWHGMTPGLQIDAAPGEQPALDLTMLDALAQRHALSYASPHHFVLSVAGLRSIIEALAAQPEAVGDGATIAGLESAVGHLSTMVDEQRRLLVEVEQVCGRDAYGMEFEDGDSELIDKVRAHLAATTSAPPPEPMSAPTEAKPAQQDAVDADLEPYDAGLLNDFGGGNVEWWQDYARAAVEAALRDALRDAPQQAEPVHWRALLDPVQRPQKLQTHHHVVGFTSLKACEAFVAGELDMNGWRYTIEPLYNRPPATPSAPTAVEPDERADMFWDHGDPERFGHDIDEIVQDYGPGEIVKIDQAKRLPTITVRVLPPKDEDSNLEYEVIDDHTASASKGTPL